MKKIYFTILPVFVLALFPFSCGTKADSGVYFSSDMSESWQEQKIKDKQVLSLNILSMVFDPQNYNVIYAGTENDGIYKKNSDGTWGKLPNRQSDPDSGNLSGRASINDISINPKDTDKIYLAVFQDSRGRVFRTEDNGKKWEEVYVVSKDNYSIGAVAVDTYDPSIVYIGTDEGGFLRSADYGKSWKIMRWFDDKISDIVVNPKDTRIIYLSTMSDGIYRSGDKGATWQSFKDNLEDFNESERITALAIDPVRTNIVYAGSEYGLLISRDSGNSWQEMKIVMPKESVPILAMAVEPKNSDHLYYGAGAILYRSLDQGKNWTVHELPTKRKISAILINPETSEIIYAGMRK